MMRALLLGAFATTAFGVECGKDVSAVSCRDFTKTSDFNIANAATGNNIDQTGVVTINQAIQFIGDTPWDKSLVAADQLGNGCMFRDESSAGDLGVATTIPATASAYTCALTSVTSCTGTAGTTASAERDYKLSHSLQHMVSMLDNAGRFEVYFQRVLENPITGGSLEWIAENACKIYVDVQFECTGSDCVEVTTIVCASFAGIDTSNFGVVSIECKVPKGFGISSTNPVTTGTGSNQVVGLVTTGANLDEAGVTNTLTSTNSPSTNTDAEVWAGTGSTVTGTAAVTGNGLTQTLTASVTTAIALGQGHKFSGSLDLSAWVQSPSAASASIWTQASQDLHSAKYNLTRASNAAPDAFSMPVNVLFYSDTASTSVLTTDTAILNAAGDSFGTANTQRPFLAKTEVAYGAITQHNHAYLSVVAKVATDGVQNSVNSVSFSSLRVTKVEFVQQGAASVDKCTNEGCCTISTTGTTYWNPVGATAVNFPRALMSCQDLMTANGPMGTDGVKAGDTLVIYLKWKLVGTAASTGTGKAALLQDAADEVQSVEVSLTIQLGGGETTITTAGGSDGSADPTVTYIIIAVCIVAAGLILAVVVVAFMCMRNRSQEAIVSMSPQKCTVAAVYDISQPKKADAMDV